jgi:Zn-dependent alcohol dehydrogenase
MKAAVLNKFNGIFDIEDVELADPVGREVVVDVRACGMCHSDLYLAQHDFGFPVPGVFGHEVAGVVLEAGPEVTSLAVGDYVVGSLIQACGSCSACWSGRTYECEWRDSVLRPPGQPPRLTRRGEPVNQIYGLGGFAERALVHENQLAKVPGAVFDLHVLADLAFPQRKLQCVFMGSTSLKRDVAMYAQLYLQGRMNLDDLVSGEVSLDEINDAYRRLVERSDVARYVITSF